MFKNKAIKDLTISTEDKTIPIHQRAGATVSSIYLNNALASIETKGGKTGMAAEVTRRLLSAVRKFKRADTRLQQKKAINEIKSIEKQAGGPGSGTSDNNTKKIGLPVSEYVTVGTRQGLTKNAPYITKVITLKYVKKVAQNKYVPEKVKSIVKDKGRALQTPIDVLQVAPQEYHLIDGHHRYLAAIEMGIKELPARVFMRRKENN